MLGYYMYLYWETLVTELTLCSTYIPCFLLYSKMPNNYELYYISTLIGFILIVYLCLIYKWLNFDQKMRWEEVNGDDKSLKVSKILLNGWDWSIDTQHEMTEMRKVIARETKLTVDEERIKFTVKHRSAQEKAKLFGIRVATFTFSFFILCCGWAAIIAVNLYEKDLEEFFNGVEILNYVVRLLQINSIRVDLCLHWW